MALEKIDPTKTKSWEKLRVHFEEIKDTHMMDWFNANPYRAEKLAIEWDDFYVDFSKNRITQKTLNLFHELVEELDLNDAIYKYFSGDKINETEDRAVLHTALRAPADSQLIVNGENIIQEITEVKKRIKTFSNSIIDGNLKGYTGKTFTDIVNIGIGGSDLGPAMVVEALQYYKNQLSTHFISNVEGDHVSEMLKNLNPETTLFIVVSKSFSTQETLTNANTVRQWFLKTQPESGIKNHFVAVSSNLEAVTTFGIDLENCFPIWDWVGGRFSLWSAVGLSIALSVGYENFDALLSGAYKMDKHFRDAPFNTNLPAILACISIWYNNFYKTESEAVIAYSQYLKLFTPYLQQASMESNGKQTNRNGETINYQTGNIVWGEPGTNSQHAFFQLLHQGTKLIPADFIGFKESLYDQKDHKQKLTANFIAQTEALLKGKSDPNLFKNFIGNRPTNTIVIKKLTPENLGKLIALYEHKIFVQGVIWNIFSFDQFGVELGKQLVNKILDEFNVGSKGNHDGSTSNLMKRFYN